MLKLVVVFLALHQLWTETNAAPALSTNVIKDVLDEEISAAITKAVNDVEKEMDDPVNDDEQDKQNAVDDDASELQFVKGRKIKDGLTVQKEYEVSFKVFPSVFNDGCHNVLHFTTGVNSGKPGSRIPGVWFCNGDSKSRTIYIVSDVSGNVNYGIESHPVPVQKWTSVDIKQIRNDDGVFLYEILIDGKVVHSKVNTLPKTFHQVSLYVSDPWHNAQPGYIKDLYYGAPKNKKEDKKEEPGKSSSITGSLNFHLSFDEIMKLMDRFSFHKGPKTTSNPKSSPTAKPSR